MCGGVLIFSLGVVLGGWVPVWGGCRERRTCCRVHAQHRACHWLVVCGGGWPHWCAWVFWVWWCGWVVCELYSGCEHLFVLWFCLVLLGIRWMPWYQELMKDVAACEMPRGVGERVLIRGCPNGGTWLGLCLVTIA